MSDKELRAQLARLAEDAPVASVPDDTYGRGRRALGRTRIIGAVVAIGCLVVAAVVGAQLAHRPGDVSPGFSGGTSDGSALGVPDHIYAPPRELPVSSTLAVGRAAAAFLDGRGQVVVVDAASGRYRRIRINDIRPPDATPVVALSPDGRHLAMNRFTGGRDGYRSDLVVVDLISGVVHYVLLAAHGEANLANLAWSPDGEWLAWQAIRMRAWTADGYQPATSYIGGTYRLADRTIRRTSLLGARYEALAVDGIVTDDSSRPRPIAVSDDGVLAAVAGTTLRVVGQGDRTLPLRPGWFVGGLAFHGPRLADVEYPGHGHAVARFFVLLPRRSASNGDAGGLRVPRLLGSIATGRLLLQQDDRSKEYEDPTTVVLAPEPTGLLQVGTPGDIGPAKAIVEVDPDVRDLTVATSLIDQHHPTLHRSEPDWPWSPRQRVAAYAGGGVGAAVLIVVCAVWWRRRAASVHRGM